MAVIVLCYEKDLGKFLAQLIEADQLAPQAITSAKIGPFSVGDGHVASGLGADKLIGRLPKPVVSGTIISGMTISNGIMTLPAFSINEDMTTLAATVLGSGAGVVDLVDGPAAASGFGSGIAVGYYYRLHGMPFMRVYAEQDGVGGLTERRLELIQQAYAGSLPVPMFTSGGYIASAFISGGLRDALMASGITAQKLLSGYLGYKVASGYPSDGLTGLIPSVRISGYFTSGMHGAIAHPAALIGTGAIVSGKINSGTQFAGIIGADRFDKSKIEITSGKLWKGAGPGADPTEIDVPVVAGFAFYASDTLRNSNDADKTTASATYVKRKETLLNADLSACRIKFTLYQSGTPQWIYGQVYKNGVAIGTEQTWGAAGESVFSEDFTGFVSGDLIQIYVHSNGTQVATVRNFRFYYDKKVATIGEQTLTTLITITSSAISVTNQDPA